MLRKSSRYFDESCNPKIEEDARPASYFGFIVLLTVGSVATFAATFYLV